MPPRKDFRQSKETDGGQAESRTMGSADAQQSERVVSVREHPMKKMQAKSHDGHGISLGLHERPPPSLLLLQSTTGRQDSMKLNRSNDLLAQSSTETLLDMLKAHEGIKECSEDTVQQINGVRVFPGKLTTFNSTLIGQFVSDSRVALDSGGAVHTSERRPWTMAMCCFRSVVRLSRKFLVQNSARCGASCIGCK